MAICTTFIEPLNLQCVFINTFAESIGIFVAVALIVIAILGARFRMINSVFLILVALFSLIMSPYLSWLWFIVLFLSTIVIYYSWPRVVK